MVYFSKVTATKNAVGLIYAQKCFVVLCFMLLSVLLTNVSATASGLEVISQIGNLYMSVNGARTRIDVAPLIVDNRTLVSVRFVSEAFGAEVVWDGVARTVFINTVARFEQIIGADDERDDVKGKMKR